MQHSNTALSVTCCVSKRSNVQFMVQLMDNNFVIVENQLCKSDCCLRFTLSPGEYVICVCPFQKDRSINPLAQYRWIKLVPYTHNAQFFIFNCFLTCKRVPVNFWLTDAHYPNLPIQEGELYLWRTIS